MPGPNRLDHPPAPFTEVRIIGQDPGASDESAESCRIALRTAAGWFVGAEVSCARYKWEDVEILALERGPDDGKGGPTIVWRHRVKDGDRGEDRDGRRYAEWVTIDSLLICGVGLSGTPACSPRIPTSEHVDTNYRYSDEQPYELSVDLAPGGVVTVHKKSSEIPRDAAALIGVHRLAFP